MYKDNSYKKILIVLGVAAVAFTGVYFLVFKDIRSKNEHASSVLDDLSKQGIKQSYFLSMQRTLENINPEISLINDSIVSKDGDVRFIEDLESMARSNGLSIEIQSLSFEESATESNNFLVFKIRAKTEGGWKGTYTFLTELESLHYKTKISNFSLLNTNIQADIGTSTTNKTTNTWKSTFELEVLKNK
ncbi:hypothetical protein H0W91_03895 [Patescibacteria group bacterium]|nr:hypothetical protein [Patescibacteria group bacterium]